jgi:protein-disulfide isomerase
MMARFFLQSGLRWKRFGLGMLLASFSGLMVAVAAPPVLWPPLPTVTRTGSQAQAPSEATVVPLSGGARVEMSVDDDPAFGPEDAPVVIIYFDDWMETYGKQFVDETLPRIVEKYGDKLRWVFRDFPIMNELGVEVAIAAECAHDQQKFLEYLRVLLNNQRILSREELVQFAADLNMETAAFSACLDDPDHLNEVRLDKAAAQQVGMEGIPAFFVNDYVLIGTVSYETFAAVIDLALEKAAEGG